jgi:hypothetical protein
MKLRLISEDEYEGLEDSDEFAAGEFYIEDAEGIHDIPVYDPDGEYVGGVQVQATNIDSVGDQHHWHFETVHAGEDGDPVIEIDGIMTVFIDLEYGGTCGYDWKGSPGFPKLTAEMEQELLNTLEIAYPII